MLKDAELLLREGRYESSINRSYYAALTAAKGLLILFGVDPKTHEGVKTMLGKNLIMAGYMSKDSGKWFRSLLFEREDVDYADFVMIDKDDASEAYDNAVSFVDEAKKAARKIIKEI